MTTKETNTWYRACGISGKIRPKDSITKETQSFLFYKNYEGKVRRVKKQSTHEGWFRSLEEAETWVKGYQAERDKDRQNWEQQNRFRKYAQEMLDLIKAQADAFRYIADDFYMAGKEEEGANALTMADTSEDLVRRVEDEE